ncbi:hypothetical protein ASD45_08590 [Pseudolabrys sp. Root1462]|uniref:hypothetical protein n=1 Tax=Pseudolabrys sp. Root1462 TaxID=1736466 RepID=UPI000703700F|nr:hypothetical protein [Pseudolabrys sp. Root1462]KQZ00911.1 hypothetical protein ASD45_08590 [Pseudolabrys sp. Root1462]
MNKLIGFLRRLSFGAHEWQPFAPAPLVTYRDTAGSILTGGILMRRRGTDRKWQYRNATDEESSLYVADSVA